MSRIGPIDSFTRRLTALIRGPARLREDIADEIADHLATRIEEGIAHGGQSVDPAAVQADALAAFGDPQQIARELRHIHLGDWIMFQRIMVAALVVIVIGMAATAYFSWSAARQQSQQFAQMNERLGTLVDLQKAAVPRPLGPLDFKAPEPKPAPPPTPTPAVEAAKEPPEPHWIKITFVAGPQNKPVPGYKCQIVWNSGPQWDIVANEPEQGVVTMDRAGLARLKGPILDANGQPIPNTFWARVLYLEHKPGSTNKYQINVSPQTPYTVKFDLSAISWDPKITRRLRVQLYGHAGESRFVGMPPSPGSAAYPQTEYQSELYSATAPGGPPLQITGVYPGPATATVQLLAGRDDIIVKDEPQEGEREDLKDLVIWSWAAETTVPEQAGPVVIKIAPPIEQKIAAVLFDGSRSKPLAKQSVRLIYPISDGPGLPGMRRGAAPPNSLSTWRKHVITEYLVTNDRGEFTAATTGDHGNPPTSTVVGRPYIVTPWHTADGKPADFVWPMFESLIKRYDIQGQGTLYEFDMSQLATLRFAFSGADKLAAEGNRFVGPIAIHAPGWWPAPPLQPSPPQRVDCLARTVDPLSKTTDLLMITGTCATDLSLVIAQTKADAPELESHKFYSRWFGQFKLTAGQMTDVPVALDELDKWKLDKTEWHQRDVPTTQSQPATK